MIQSQLFARCTHCSARHPVQAAYVGKQARCPRCQQLFIVALEPLPASPADTDTLSSTDSAIDSRATDSRAADSSAAAASPPGESFGRFALQQLLGQGAFGRVYQAHDPHLDRFVALKIPTFGPADAEKVQRFLTEAKAAARLRHPNIIPVYESGQVAGQYYIAAQFVSGQTLAQRLSTNPPSFTQAAEWTQQLATALAYAHAAGVIHRDIKPENILLDEHDSPQIMDFGLAKRLNEDASHTTDGAILGTPAYMPPEQARGEVTQVGPASDQYSLGVVLYELLTGQKPFSGPPHAVIAQLINDEPPRPRQLRPEIPAELEAICLRAMQKKPAARYPSAAGLATDLQRWLHSASSSPATPALVVSSPASSRLPWKWIGVGMGLLALVAILATILLSPAEPAPIASSPLPSSVPPPPEVNPPKPDPEPIPPGPDTGVEPPPDPDPTPSAPASTQPGTPPSDSTPENEPSRPPAVDPAPPPVPPVPTIDQAYRDSIAQVQTLLRAGDLRGADKALKSLPADQQRTWEARYLARRAQSAPTITFTIAPGVPRALRFSSNGRTLLAGGGGGRLGDAPWNAIYDISERRWNRLGPAVNTPAGGRVCAFSQDGETILAVRNDPASGLAMPHLWNTESPARAPQRWPAIQGFALDCAPSSASQWCVLTATLSHLGGDQIATLQPPLTLWTLSGEQQAPLVICQEPFLAACLGRDPFAAHVLVLGDQETSWLSYNLPAGPPQSRSVGLPLATSQPQVKGAHENLHDWRVTTASGLVFTSHESNSSSLLLDLSDANSVRREQLPSRGTALFAAAAHRLFVVTADDSTLRLYDPAASLRDPPILSLPLVGAANAETGWIGIEQSTASGQIAVALDDTITLVEVPLAR